MKKIVIAGATGYLGQHLVKSFKGKGYYVIAISRSHKKLQHLEQYIDELILADVRKIETLEGFMAGADMIVSTVGITRQKDGLTYMDVDYMCNKNLLEVAKISGVKKFMYIAALNGDHLKEFKIMNAKEKFVDLLSTSTIDSYVIRPSGFFSDIGEVYHMAKKGRVYNISSGQFKANPIDGSDLADFCTEVINKKPGVYPVGGPDILSQKELSIIAFNILGKKARISKIPLGLVKMLKILLVKFTKETYHGPLEFFLTVLSMDMVAPSYGKKSVQDYFKLLKEGK